MQWHRVVLEGLRKLLACQYQQLHADVDQAEHRGHGLDARACVPDLVRDVVESVMENDAVENAAGNVMGFGHDSYLCSVGHQNCDCLGAHPGQDDRTD
jgi:hypothetical protein